MSVTECKKIFSNASRDKAAWTFTEKYRVLMDDPSTDGEYEAITAAGLPAYAATHHSFATAYATKFSAEPENPPEYNQWIVTVEYATLTGNKVEPKEDPLAEDPVWSWGKNERTIACKEDKDGNAIVNSAKDMFDPPVEAPIGDLELTMKSNEANYDPHLARTFIYTVNTNAVTCAGYSWPARSVLCTDYTASEAYRNGTHYWEVTKKFVFAWSAWDFRVLDHGVNHLVGGVSVPNKTAASKEKLGDTQRLDGAGNLLAPAAASVFIAFKIYPESDFSSLGLGNAPGGSGTGTGTGTGP